MVFYPEFMDNMGELLGNDFFILPSSIHEMLVLPDDGQVDAEMLRDMVKEVNATQVALQNALPMMYITLIQRIMF